MVSLDVSTAVNIGDAHRLFTCAWAKEGKSKAKAMKGRDRATEKNMKGTAAKGLYADHLRRARLLRREGQADKRVRHADNGLLSRRTHLKVYCCSQWRQGALKGRISS